MSEQQNKIKDIWLNKAKAVGYNTAATLMSSLYPIDFEAYMIAFELCNSQGKTIDYFTFPIMPTEISIEEEIPVKVENTFGGVNTVSSNIFVPKSINLSGNFGRNFKILIRDQISTPLSYLPIVHKAIQERDYGVGGVQGKVLELTNFLKTGYGCFKVLQSIINRSVEVDEFGECNRLYMYNMCYGENYLVKPISFRGAQSTSNNGLWNYDLNLKAVCPLHLDAHKRGKKIKAYIMASAQSIANTALNGVRQTYNINN